MTLSRSKQIEIHMGPPGLLLFVFLPRDFCLLVVKQVNVGAIKLDCNVLCFNG